MVNGAWDKKEKKMWNNDDFIIESTGELDLVLPYNSDDYILMQYTGLKDKKNGKEIYEGDILKLQYKKAHPNIIVIRNYIEDTFHLEDELGWGNTRCIVIGNIYENPDLVEKF